MRDGLSPQEAMFVKEYLHLYALRVEVGILSLQELEQRVYSRGEKKTFRIEASLGLARKHQIPPERHAAIMERLSNLLDIG